MGDLVKWWARGRRGGNGSAGVYGNVPDAAMTTLGFAGNEMLPRLALRVYRQIH